MSNRIDLTQFNGYTKPDEKLFLEEMQEAFERAVVLDETVSCVDANLALFAPYLLAELKRCYEEIDEVTKWKDHWKRTSQTWSKVVEIFDPKANNAELNDAINKAFGHDASE